MPGGGDQHNLPFLILVEVSVLGLGNTPFPVMFWVVVGCLLCPLLWLYQACLILRYVVNIVNDDGMYLPIVILNLLLGCFFTSDLYHSSISIDYPVSDGH